MQPLLNRFIRTFQKAISSEMEAMRQRLGPFEVPLDEGKVLNSTGENHGKLYRFKSLKPNEKLVLQAECTLRYGGGEALVTITEIDQAEIVLRSERNINLSYDDYILVIYPWFLYEKLMVALESLPASDDFYVSNALLLFGQGQSYRNPRPLQAEHTELNTGQQKAVQLCSDSNLAFVWGPPGSGKTTTLGHIVAELLRQGQSIINDILGQAIQAGIRVSWAPGYRSKFGSSAKQTGGTDVK